MRPFKAFVLSSLAALVLAAPAAAEHGNADQASPNMFHLANSPKQPTNSDLAFWQGGPVKGPFQDLAFAGNYNGFRIFDISKPWLPRLLTDFRCRGNQGDGSTHQAQNRLLYIQSVDNPVTTDECATAVDTPLALYPLPDGGFGRFRTPGFEGLRVFDVTNPLTPVHIASVATACGSHTHTTIPDDRNQRLIVYVSSQPAGSQQTPPNADFGGPRCTQPHAKISIVEIPYSAPEAAHVLKEQPLHADTLPFNFGATSFGIACHDITAFLDPHMPVAFAACQSEGQLWDISDPANPSTLTNHTHIRNPQVNYWHSAAFTWDNEVVAMSDESFFGGCRGPEDTEGNIWFYKVVPPGAPDAPLLGRYVIPRPQPPNEYCSAHNMNVIPTNDGYIGVSAFYEGGTSVFDFTNPAAPREIAFFDPSGVDGRGTGVPWSSYWYNDYIFTNDIVRGFDVFRVLGEGGRQFRARKWHHANPQTQEEFQSVGLGR